VEILDLRHFSSVDMRPLLDDETRAWASLLSWDYHGSAEMILRYVDAKILPGYAAIDRGRIFGYSFFVYEGSKGVVGDLFVANGGRFPNARRGALPGRFWIRDSSAIRGCLWSSSWARGLRRQRRRFRMSKSGVGPKLTTSLPLR